jgi:pimeloyl-ACP methyl ester carboxylesterase
LLLEGIVESYPAFFKDDDTLRRYWSDQEGPLGTVRMSTPLLTGYYDLLPAGANNVLIGYSQGGLVARYLAFLDEYVFGEGRIAGVITLHAPNHGSPLAHATKTEAIKNGLMDSLLWLLSIDPERYGGTRKYLESVPFGVFWELLHTVYQDLEKRVTAGTLPAEDATFRGVRSGLKWLSGLRPLEFPTAFGDLGANNYWSPFSVISLIHRFPLRRIVSGAIVGANGQLGPMAAATLGNLVGGLAMSTFNRFNLDSAAQAYAEQVMQEDWSSLPEAAVFLKRYLAEYTTADGQKIPGMAHDFVVPATSQVLDHDLRSVGTSVNPEANHLSGSYRSRAGHGNAAGDANFNLLLQQLLKMKERLKNGS